jgi:aspartate/methionine/tyrosine aminotransferase
VAFFFTKTFARFNKRARHLTGGDPRAVRLYSDRVLATPVESLLDPALYARPVGPDVIDLNQAAPRFESPASAGRLTADRLGPPPGWGLPALREAVATRLGCTADDVLVTRGASGAFSAALDAFVNPGDAVVFTDPCSPLFSIGAASRRAEVRRVPVAWDRTMFRRMAHGAKLIALGVPNNPTGTGYSTDTLAELVIESARAGAILYLDGTFATNQKLPGGIRVLRAGSATAVGLSGLRVGWLAGPQGLVRPCALTQALAGPFVPAVCQQVVTRLLGEPEVVPTNAFAARRAWAADRLAAMGLKVDTAGEGPFLWVSVRGLKLTGRPFADRLLAEQKVVVGPGDLFGPSGTDYVRVSVAADDGRVREGLARMAAFAATVTGKPAVTAAKVKMDATIEERPPAFSRI